MWTLLTVSSLYTRWVVIMVTLLITIRYKYCVVKHIVIIICVYIYITLQQTC